MLEHLFMFIMFGIATYICAVIAVLLSIIVEQLYIGIKNDD